MSVVEYVATVHALQRFEERWPDDADDDHEAAVVMQREVEDALRAGRVSGNFPRLIVGTIFASPYATPGQECVWTEDCERGYVISDKVSSVHIITVIRRDEDAF